jgi:predicted phosphodiesterase
MRIRVYSDLHLEFGPFDPPSSADVDVVVLAGDIDVKGRGVAFAERFPCPVVYVPGNHEYYGGSIPRLTEKLKEAARGSHVHVLDGDSVVLGGTRVLGANSSSEDSVLRRDRFVRSPMGPPLLVLGPERPKPKTTASPV